MHVENMQRVVIKEEDNMTLNFRKEEINVLRKSVASRMFEFETSGRDKINKEEYKMLEDLYERLNYLKTLKTEEDE